MPTDPIPPEPTPSTEGGSPPGDQPRPRLTFLSRPLFAGAAAIALLVIGVGIGAVVTHHRHWRATEYVPLAPVAISTMTDWSTVAIKGQVAEIFGNKFILQDASGRALVETGHQGEDGDLVVKDEAVTVQGRFEHGFLHAAFIVHGDGETVALDQPHGPPPHCPPDGPRGHRAEANPPGALPAPAP